MDSGLTAVTSVFAYRLMSAGSSGSTTGTLSLLVAVITVVIAIAGALGAWAALRVGRQSAIVNNYRESANSWETMARAQKERLEEMEQDLASAKAGYEQKMHESETMIAALRSRVEALTELVTGQQKIESLSLHVAESFKSLDLAMSEGFGNVMSALGGKK